MGGFSAIRRLFGGQQNPLYPQGAEYGGPPPDFPGAVIPNPNNAKPQLDTDPPPTDPLTKGAAMLYGNATKPTMDVSNPPANQMGAPEMREVGTEPQRGQLAQSMQPSANKSPMSEQEFGQANPSAATAFMPVRPVGDFDANTPHPKLRSALASLFAGLAEFGRPGAGQGFANRWLDQSTAQRTYDANQPKLQAGALNQAYQQYLQQGGEQANISHTQQETENLRQNVPLLQHQQQFLDKVRQLKQDGKYANDDDLLNAVLPEAQTVPGLTRQMILDQIHNAKPLGAQFNVQTDKQGRPEFVQDRAGQKYYPDAQGKFQNPEMQKQWDSEMASHSQSLSEEEGKEKRVAGYAADRQAAGFAQAQKMEGVKATNDRVNTALDADERLSRMERSYQKALKGDQQAMLALLTDHLGMTMGIQKGARITRDILNEAQNSQPWLSRVEAKFNDNGYLSGAALGPDQMKQMLDLGYEARDRAYGSAHDAATTYGVALPKGMENVERKRVTGAKPAIEQGSDVIYARDPQGKLHKAAKGTALPQGWKAENAPTGK